MRKLKIAVIALLTAGVLGTGVALVGCASAPDPEQAVRASLESELGVFQNPSQEQIDELVADLAGTDEFTTYGIELPFDTVEDDGDVEDDDDDFDEDFDDDGEYEDFDEDDDDED